MRVGASHRQSGLMQRCKRQASRTRDRLATALLLVEANALGFAILLLAVIGAPPQWRINILWISRHADIVRAMLLCVGVAGVASVVLALWRKPRGWMLAIWVLAGAIAVGFFWEQLHLISRMLIRHNM